MYARSRLQRGVEPYADANETAVRGGHVPFVYDTTRYGAGTAIKRIAPCDGFLREFVALVTTLTAGAGVLTIAINGVSVGTTVAVPDASALDTQIKTSFNADATLAVKKGDLISITVDATPTAGELTGWIWIDPRAAA